MGELEFQLGILSRAVVEHALESSGELVKTQMTQSYGQRFLFSRSGWVPRVCILVSFQVMLTLLVEGHILTFKRMHRCFFKTCSAFQDWALFNILNSSSLVPFIPAFSKVIFPL